MGASDSGPTTRDDGTRPDSGALDSTGEPLPGEPRLVIDGAPRPYDFGQLSVGETLVARVVVRNTGSAPATGIAGPSLGVPFDYTGGAFPGVGGDCSSTLDAGASCDVELEYAPTAPGLHDEILAVAYDGATATTRPLAGEAHGQSANLLINPGGEDFSTPPTGWTNAGMGTWVAGDPWDGIPPILVGKGYLAAHQGPSFEVYRLRQDVSVAQWTDLIDRGALSVSFVAHARSWTLTEDEYSLGVQYLDQSRSPLETWEVGWSTDDSWQMYSDERVAPVGTRVIRVELRCQKAVNDNCDAFFDELDLRVSYP